MLPLVPLHVIFVHDKSTPPKSSAASTHSLLCLSNIIQGTVERSLNGVSAVSFVGPVVVMADDQSVKTKK